MEEIKKLESSVEQYTTEAKKVWEALLPAVKELEEVIQSVPNFYSYNSNTTGLSLRTVACLNDNVFLCVNDRPFTHDWEQLGFQGPTLAWRFPTSKREEKRAKENRYIIPQDLLHIAKNLSSFILELCQFYTDKAQALKEVREKYLK